LDSKGFAIILAKNGEKGKKKDTIVQKK